MNFIPMCRSDVAGRGWDELDIVFVTGDAYIDHPAFGVPLLARWLESQGFRVGIISQPDWNNPEAFRVLGRPRLFFAVTAGAMDSMVAHYTPEKRLRRDDAYTPGNRHGARPNRATIVYTSCCKAAYRDVPVVIGGIEASLRRFAHYDFWDDKVRRSILFDSKADLLIYGMGERPLLELADRLRCGEPFDSVRDIAGTAYAGSAGSAVELPSYEEVVADTRLYAKAYRIRSDSQNPLRPVVLVQKHAGRYLVCNPPSLPLSQSDLDALYLLPFTRMPHPVYIEPIPAWEQIKTSVTTHRGCYGGCSFCAITHHQGRFIQSRSIDSVLRELERLASFSWFRGSVSDLGGPTANMYGTGCGAADSGAACRRQSCLHPEICRYLVTDDRTAVTLLRKVRSVPRVRHAFVSSGIRYDLLERQPAYLEELVAHHVSGLLKVAPEHCSEKLLRIMRKPGIAAFERFLAGFFDTSRRVGKRQSIVPYLMSGHPGTTLSDMLELALYIRRQGIRVEQVQEFTPTPGTLATCIYYTGIDPFSGETVYVARGDREKHLQKALLLSHLPEHRNKVIEALRLAGRMDAAPLLLAANGNAATGSALLSNERSSTMPGRKKKSKSS